MTIFTGPIRSHFYFINLVLLAMSIVLSRFTMSVFQFTLVIMWLWWGYDFGYLKTIFKKNNIIYAFWKALVYSLATARNNFVERIRILAANKVALVVVSLYALHVLGLVHTEDYTYALKDLRIKLPLLLMPLIMSTMDRISWKQMKVLLLFYVLAIFISTMFSLNEYLRQDFTEIREIVLFINPIRFSLNIVFAFYILMWFVAKGKSMNRFWRFGGLTLIMGWFVAFLIILESLIGILSLFVISLGIILVQMIKIRNLVLKTTLLAMFVILPIAGFLHIKNIVDELVAKPEIDFASLPTHTRMGNLYVHDTINYGVEDGTYIGLFLAEEELKTAWNQRSKIDFMGLDSSNHEIRFTLIRYLNSKNLPKDAEGLAALSAQDIARIERGVANYNYITRPSLRMRISKVITAINNYNYLHDPSGSSVLQRIEYIRASILIIKNNFWFGVGTGDPPMVFVQTYEEMNTALKKEFRWRSHNQYLSVFIAFGVFGLLWFIITLLYPMVAAKRYRSFFYLVFLAIIMLSMLTEDTIESQDGVTLFAFFNALWLFAFTANEEAEESHDRPRLSEHVH